MRIQKNHIVLSALLFTVFTGPVFADCTDIPAAPAALSEEVLDNSKIELLKPELDAFLIQLGSLRDCIKAQENALTPPPTDPSLNEEQEPPVDYEFLAAIQALSDAALLVDQLEERSILRFNYLVEHVQENTELPNSSSTTQP